MEQFTPPFDNSPLLTIKAEKNLNGKATIKTSQQNV